MSAGDESQSDQFDGHSRHDECSTRSQRRQKRQGGDNNSPSREQQKKTGKLHPHRFPEIALEALGQHKNALRASKDSCEVRDEG